MRLRCDVSAVTQPDLSVVAALAWAQLQAKRDGDELCLCRCPDRLAALLDVTGLAEVLPTCALGVEVVGQPEQREEAGGVEEEADPRDRPV